MNYPATTPAFDLRFPDDGFPWQVEHIATKTVKPDHDGVGGETYEEWVAVYQNFADAHRAVIYTGHSKQEVLDWVNTTD